MRECVARTRRPRTVRIDRVIHTALVHSTAQQCCHKLIVRIHSSAQQPDQSRATDITWPPPNRYANNANIFVQSTYIKVHTSKVTKAPLHLFTPLELA